jgi:hypothetical protein
VACAVVPAAAYKGPGVFARCLAARQLACAVQLLPPAALTQHLGLVLPLLRAAIDDPSPAVQRYGHAGVQWLAVMAGGEQLAWQQELLLHVANKMVVGCDPAVWGSALPAATRLVLVSNRVCDDSWGGGGEGVACHAPCWWTHADHNAHGHGQPVCMPAHGNVQGKELLCVQRIVHTARAVGRGCCTPQLRAELCTLASAMCRFWTGSAAAARVATRGQQHWTPCSSS